MILFIIRMSHEESRLSAIITSPINCSKQEAQRRRIAMAKMPVPPSPASSDVRNFVQELAELTKLFREGFLTEQEFTRAKVKLLN
jgi:hypothetical protein